MKRQYIITIAALLGILMSASCQKETGDAVQTRQDGGFLSFSPSVASLVESDSAPVKASLINEDGSGSELPQSMEFQVAAWDVKDSKMTSFISPFETVKYVEGEVTQHVNMWITVDDSDDIIEHRWKQGEEKLFYAYANNGSDGVTVEGGDTDAPTMELTHSLDNQNDVLMGIYDDDGKTGSKMTGTASIAFAHPLAAVEFKMGTIVAPAESFKITGIKMEGLYTEGTATMSKDGTIAWSACSGNGSLSQTVSVTPASGQVGEAFLVIPQTFDSDLARVELSATLCGTPIKLYIALKNKTLSAGCVTSLSINYDAHSGVQLWEDGPYWATCNVGADQPEDYGLYFSWANIKGYTPELIKKESPLDFSDYDYFCYWKDTDGVTASYTLHTKEFYKNTTGNALGANITSAAYDPAMNATGGLWRMPTKEEFEDLKANTDHEIFTCNGVAGTIFRGKAGSDFVNRFIFLPSAGYGSGFKYDSADKKNYAYYSYFAIEGRYWTSSYYSGGGSISGDGQAYLFNWSSLKNSGAPSVITDSRFCGYSVRAVENF